MVDHCYLACSFLPKVLQRGVAEVVFPPQMLHTADQPGLTHCVAGRFMAFGAGPAYSWTRFHSRSRMARLELMKAEPT